MMKNSKKYKVIAKVGGEKFVKYNVNNLILFTAFLDRQFPSWTWYNVYDKESRKQLSNFTKKQRPINKHL